MARRTLRLLPYKGRLGYHYYLDGLKVNGKRKRLFFTTEAEAKEELKKWDRRIRKEGEDALAISQELRILAAKCAKRLEPFEKSIWDATEFYIEHLERMRGSVPVTVLLPITLRPSSGPNSRKNISPISSAPGSLRCRLFRQSDQDSNGPGDRRLAPWTRSFPSNGQ
jgi:hypothetical protein